MIAVQKKTELTDFPVSVWSAAVNPKYLFLYVFSHPLPFYPALRDFYGTAWGKLYHVRLVILQKLL